MARSVAQLVEPSPLTAPLAEETYLAELLEDWGAERLFQGLLSELPHCAASDDMDSWEDCGHAIVALLASRRRSAIRAASP